MKAINLKLLRDFVAMRGQAFAIGAVVACGIAVFVMARSTLVSLETARDDYYAKNRFADVFAALVRAPGHIAERASSIDGIAAVDHRVTEALTLDMPGLAEPASGRILSLPQNVSGSMNQVHLIIGRQPDPDRAGEILVSGTFAEAHDIRPGQRLKGTIRGRSETLTVVGIAMSPEFLIQIQPGSLFPDDKRFGVFWMARQQLEAVADMEGAFNDLAIQLSKSANADEVIRHLDQLLEPYGSTGAYTREDHLSAAFIDEEIKGLHTMGMIPPAIFLGVAAFLLSISLRRILSLQREQIAALKAFGYSDLEVGWHYTKLIAMIVVSGAAVGSLLGTLLGAEMTEMYRVFYRFPVSVFAPSGGIYVTALGLAAVSGFIGVLGGIRATVKLPPAEAMRPAAPATYKKTLLERLGLEHWFSQPARMVVREIERRPLKAMFTTLGIAFACAILMVGSFGKDSIDHMIDFQFSTAERDDARVQFVDAVPQRALYELESINGVLHTEPFRNVPARLRNGSRSKETGVVGMADGGQLFRLLDADGQQIPLGGSGVVLSRVLSDILDIRVGDMLQIEVLDGERPVRHIRVTGLVEDYTGTAAYMNLDALNRLLREGHAISGAYLQLDNNLEDEVFAALKERPAVASVSLKKATMQGFLDTFAENLLRMRLINMIFASVIAIGVVYSSARISFSERGRDLATLRVIGLTKGEVSRILLGELAVFTAVAIPVGFLIGYSLCYFIMMAMDTELFRMPVVITTSSYGRAALIVLAASIASALLVRKKIDHLDLVTALKVRE